MSTGVKQSEIRCLVDSETIEQYALTYASDVCSKVGLLARMAPSLANKAELAQVLAHAVIDLHILQELLSNS